MTQTTYSIGELAREFDVTSRTIRFYEDRGLLAPARRGRQRVYAQRDRVRLKLILRGKRLGFSLGEIAEILDLYDAPEGEAGQLRFFIEKIRERHDALQRQRDDLEVALSELEGLEQHCARLLDAHERRQAS